MVDEPTFGWQFLDDLESYRDTEIRVVDALTRMGALVKHAGDRSQSYDLEIFSRLENKAFGVKDPFLGFAGLFAGRYEVKKLYRPKHGRSFDPRFKVGTRGEKIYGKTDAQIKSFAQALEREMDNIIDHSIGPEMKAEPGTVWRATVEVHEMVDRAIERKHSKDFIRRLTIMAKSALSIPNLTVAAHAFLSGGVQAADIHAGFEDIEGIFLVAGANYTLVSKGEFRQFLAFDSASSEGPKLRFTGRIPCSNEAKSK